MKRDLDGSFTRRCSRKWRTPLFWRKRRPGFALRMTVFGFVALSYIATFCTFASASKTRFLTKDSVLCRFQSPSTDGHRTGILSFTRRSSSHQSHSILGSWGCKQVYSPKQIRRSSVSLTYHIPRPPSLFTEAT